MDVAVVSDLIGALTPILLIGLAGVAFSAWRNDRRQAQRLDEERLHFERDRARFEEARERAEKQEREQARKEEAEFRRATLVPEDDPEGVFILHLHTTDPVLALRAVAAAQALYVAQGFERPEIAEITRGSVKVKLRTRIANFFRDARTREVMDELRIAAEEASIGRVASENNERNASAAARLMEAMASMDAAEFISPTMAVIKTTDGDGKSRIQVRVPTARELVELRRRPDTDEKSLEQAGSSLRAIEAVVDDRADTADEPENVDESSA